MRTLALTVAYDGTDWAGFQRLTTRDTVQGALEAALSEVFQHPVTVSCAGRTDAGVHALGQVVSFLTPSTMPIDRVGWVTNRHLPPTIRIRRATEKAAPFHARFSAAYRRYWYVIQQTKTPDPIWGRFRWQMDETLDTTAMAQALSVVHGTHDFTAFCHRGLPKGSRRRTIHRAMLRPWAHGVIVDLQADAFLHQMMRLLVGNLVRIGTGERAVSWLGELLQSRNRHLAGVGAPPQGLFLMRIGYPPTVNPRWGSLVETINYEVLPS